jgi:outer membrane biosynthesis protein TonB
VSDEKHEEELIGGGGGGGKYAVIGLLLFAAAGALYYFTLPKTETPVATQTPVATPPPAPAPQAHFDNGLDIAEEEPDAGAPVEETARRTGTGGGGNADWSCTGEIATAQASSAFRSHSGEVRQCYERKLRTDPMLQGTLSVRLKIGTGGTVQGVQVGGSLRDAEVVACVRERARTWRFPGPAGGCAVIAAPFSLTPRQ